MKLKIYYQVFMAICTISLVGHNSYAQEFSKDLPPFKKVIVGNRVNLVIHEGDNFHIKGGLDNVNLEELNIKVKNGKLMIYLDKAKVYERNKTVKIAGYRRKIAFCNNNVSVNVHLTCDVLEKLEIRGQQEVICEKTIDNEKFKLIAYGGSHIRFNSLNVDKLKVRAYGENDIDILGGDVKNQVYKVYGENSINTHHVKNDETRIVSFGESSFWLVDNKVVKISSIGESTLMHGTSPDIKRRLMVGDNTISEINLTKK